MSKFFWWHVFALLLLTIWTSALEFNDEKSSAEDEENGDDFETKQNEIPHVDPAFAKDTLQRKNPQDNGNSLKELWEMVPLKQQAADLK